MERRDHVGESAQELFALAELRREHGDRDGAQALFRGAALAAELGELHGLAVDAWSLLARLHWFGSEPRMARRCFERAERAARANHDEESVSGIVLRRAFLAYDEGELDVASCMLEEAQFLPLDDARRGLREGYLGNVARARGALGDARSHYLRAVEHLGRSEMASVFRMDRAVVELLEGNATEALKHLDVSLEAATVRGRLIHHYARIAEWALAIERPRAEVPDEGPFDRFIMRCAEVFDAVAVHEVGDAHLSALRSAAPPGEHARLTLRIVRLFAKRVDGHDDLLRLEAGRVALGSDLVVQLSPQSAEWRIVWALAAHHGRALSAEELVRHGWPGEKIVARAGRNRLHVALSSLRRKGLREILLRDDDGYLLSPALRVLARDQSASE